jgi:hypothetical protein
MAMVAALVAVYLTVHWVSRRVRADGERTWDTGPKPPSTTPRQRVQELRQHDPGFSVGVLEDFLTGLFVRVHEARGRNALDDVGAWLSAPALTALSRRSGEGPVTGLVVGALRFTRYAENAGRYIPVFRIVLGEPISKGAIPAA